MRETVAPAKLLDRRKITTVAGVLPHGRPAVDYGKSNGLRPPCVIRAIFQKHIHQRVIDFTRTDKFMTQFGDRLDPLIRPCGTSVVNRSFRARRDRREIFLDSWVPDSILDAARRR